MRKNIFVFTILLSAILLIFGCTAQTKLADYQPKSAAKREVVKFVTECDEAYQDRNFPKYLECFHDDAKIRTRKVGAGRKHPIVSKPQYENWLEEGGDSDMPRSGILNPEIAIIGDSAEIKFLHYEGDFSVHETYDLVKDNEKWKIIKSDWTWKGISP